MADGKILAMVPLVALMLSAYLVVNNQTVEMNNSETLAMNIDKQIKPIIEGESVEVASLSIHIYDNIRDVTSNGRTITISYTTPLNFGGITTRILDYSNYSTIRSIKIDGLTAGATGDYTLRSILRADGVLLLDFNSEM